MAWVHKYPSGSITEERRGSTTVYYGHLSVADAQEFEATLMDRWHPCGYSTRCAFGEVEADGCVSVSASHYNSCD